MDRPNVWLFVVMLVAGLVGGGLNYVRSRREEPENTTFSQSVLGGIVASFLVPLFLNMISSNLLDAIRGTPGNVGDLSKLFILAGFCLVASVSSKHFISTLSDRILREAKATRQEVRQMKSEVEPLIDKETEKEPQDTRSLSVPVPDDSPAGNDARLVLKALSTGRYTLRTRTGIGQDTGIEAERLDKVLRELAALGFVRKVKIMTHGELKTRWYLGEKGRALLA